MPATLPVTLASAAAFSSELADLTETELIAAIHASDYEMTVNPDPSELAAYAVQGLRFRGRLGIAQDAIQLLSYWLTTAQQEHHSAAKVAKIRAAHSESFDADLIIHISFVVQSKRREIRSTRTGHGCPVCGDFHGQINPECAAEFASRSWLSCPECEGTGWDSTGMEIYCRICGGSKLVEAADPAGAVAA
ncbi:hypothetical protein [Streptacidiphilus sp. MAP5-3]|uniref:hypothetical protein n=1 Tax=unclassified Streptacidiphilus TaxID=2643834 RepID=UPI0035155E23